MRKTVKTPVYEKYNNLLHGNRPKSDKIVSVKFMKKYIHIAKSIKPLLTDEVREVISEFYSKLRSFEKEQDDVARTQPITPRALETMIRLSTAHAKGRLSLKVEMQDAHAAIELVQFAYFKKIIEKPKKHKTENGSDGEEQVDSEMEEDGEEVIPRKRVRSAPADAYDFDEDAQAEPVLVVKKSSQKPKVSTTQVEEVVELSSEKLKDFRKLLNEEFRKLRVEKLVLSEVEQTMSGSFSTAEIKAALENMQHDNQIMLADGDIFLI